VDHGLGAEKPEFAAESEGEKGAYAGGEKKVTAIFRIEARSSIPEFGRLLSVATQGRFPVLAREGREGENRTRRNMVIPSRGGHEHTLRIDDRCTFANPLTLKKE